MSLDWHLDIAVTDVGLFVIRWGNGGTTRYPEHRPKDHRVPWKVIARDSFPKPDDWDIYDRILDLQKRKPGSYVRAKALAEFLYDALTLSVAPAPSEKLPVMIAPATTLVSDASETGPLTLF